VPPIINLIFVYPPCPNTTYMGPFYWQLLCDVTFATVGLVLAAVYAHFWPKSYLDTPKAKGLVLAGNIFSAVASMTEVVDFFLDPWEWLEAQSVAKIILYVIGDVLGFTSTVLSIVDPPKPS
jgi:hypothetical protein